jgi:dipeptidyl aminopeptidase/acylaminoacyl peptidase
VTSATDLTTPSNQQTDADWRRRFRGARVTLPEWAERAPDRLIYGSNESGTSELYTWDRSTGRRTQITKRKEGTLSGAIGPTGEHVVWFDDTDGDEFGRWVFQPFEGGEATPLPLERAYSAGLNLGDGLAVVGRSTDDGTTIHVLPNYGEPRVIYSNVEHAYLGGLSADQKLLCFHHSEHGDSRHPALRVVDLDGNTVGELNDGPGLGLESNGFSEVPGDERVLVIHERDDLRRPLLWWPRTGETRLLELSLRGDVDASWYPDGKAILIEHQHAGRSQLFRLELEPERLVEIQTQPGTISDAAARPDGEVWYEWSDAATSSEIRSIGVNGEEGVVLRPESGEIAPGGVRYSDLWVGDVHAFVAEPARGRRPFPTIFIIHGGPEWHDRDGFSPAVQAWIDHGLAVVMVNYRGSTGYGRAWRDSLTGNPGLTELEDIAAVWQRVVDEGIADREQIVLSGNSWGGYLTLLGLGLQPRLWALGVAGVPVADYIAAYEDEMEPLKAYDRALFGATPEEDPQRYIDRSPLTFIDNVSARVFILAGENDPRCPIRQIDNYIAKLDELHRPYEVFRFDAGHGSQRMDERVRQQEAEIDFVARHVCTTPPL